MDTCRYLLVGDSAVTVEFSREILPETSQKIRALKEQIATARISGE